MKTSKEVERLGTELRNWPRIEEYGRSLPVAYTLDQGEKGDDEDDDSLLYFSNMNVNNLNE